MFEMGVDAKGRRSWADRGARGVPTRMHRSSCTMVDVLWRRASDSFERLIAGSPPQRAPGRTPWGRRRTGCVDGARAVCTRSRRAVACMLK